MGVAKVYVVGAGLSGLAAAVRLAGRGVAVELIETAAKAGGRCRSYFDSGLGMTIDNGNHLVLTGNRATFGYLRAIGAEHRLAGPKEAVFDFCDVRDGRRWTVRPNRGPIAWWTLSSRRRVPGTKARDHLALLALLGPQGRRRLGEAIACEGPLWERLIEPLMLAALNIEPARGSAALAAAVVRETLALGGQACRPRIATPSLEAAFVAPALAFLERRGARLRFGRRLQSLAFEGRRVVGLRLAGQDLSVGADDAVVLALPPWVVGDLIPQLQVPDAFTAIVNAHYRIAAPAGAPAMLGVIGGRAQWIFAFEDRISVTASGADAIVELARPQLAAMFWRDVAKVHGLAPELPPWQIVKERRATFAATPAQAARRPGARTCWTNLALAGDWTDTGLPATIEGAVRSGDKAARLVLA
ncbi:MAG TPA: hydroxysqualene dehydroxylase HpnE [Caulobacteraceae bacterium]|nr:hydroxysqualene dehydroxylase HpnE [Caulobacteraceae bacterium]